MRAGGSVGRSDRAPGGGESYEYEQSWDRRSKQQEEEASMAIWRRRVQTHPRIRLGRCDGWGRD